MEAEAQQFSGHEEISLIDAPTRTLSPASSNAMNILHSAPNSSSKTIRTIPPDSFQLDPSSSPEAEEARRAQSKSEQMPHSAVKQSSSVPVVSTPSQSNLTRQNSIPIGSGLVRTISAEFGSTRSYNTSPNPSDDTGTLSPNGSATPQWSSAVGRANLGKSGRVIERLMGENDMLKRDLKLEALRAEESKQAVKMAEGKMEALAGEYEGRLHDAAINKTLLKRRERQLADLKGQVEQERTRAEKAEERERGWRDAMEREREDCKRKVEEAQTYAALMEGRNKAMASHWKDQGAEVAKTVGKLGREIKTLVEERRLDDNRMNMLQGLCEQQKEELGKLRAEKEDIGLAFEQYKNTQEELLKDIKARAREQERKNELVLKESQKVLDELKWALGVKKNVRGAQ